MLCKYIFLVNSCFSVKLNCLFKRFPVKYFFFLRNLYWFVINYPQSFEIYFSQTFKRKFLKFPWFLSTQNFPNLKNQEIVFPLSGKVCCFPPKLHFIETPKFLKFAFLKPACILIGMKPGIYEENILKGQSHFETSSWF